MSGHIYSLPYDVVKILFENSSVRGSVILAHSFRSAVLIEEVRQNVFRIKYGEIANSEMSMPIERLIAKISYSISVLPRAIGLGMDKDLLTLKFEGEMIERGMSIEESARIYHKINGILQGIS